MSDWDDWFRKLGGRRGFLFPDIEEIIEEMEEEMKDLMTRRLPDGPLVYGYSVRIGPNGKPIIKGFGNINPGQPQLYTHAMEPLIDVIEDDEDVEVIAELLGVPKEDIQLHATEQTVTINVDTPERRYHKELELPKIDESSARSTYENGILRINFKKKAQGKGTKIRIE